MTTPLKFSWHQIADFRATMLAHGGSTDVGSSAEPGIPTDVDISGRYARNYSRELPDVPGRTISFYASTNRPGVYGTPEYLPLVALTGCPWGTAAERDATYMQLAHCGCSPNDMRHSDPTLEAIARAARSGEPSEIRSGPPQDIVDSMVRR